MLRAPRDLLCAAGSGDVVDNNARLVVVAIDVEVQAGSIVLERVGFHMDTARNELTLFEKWGYAVKHVVMRPFNVAYGLLFERFHAIDIHGSCSGDEVALVVAFSAKGEGDQVAAIVENAFVDKLIAALVPPTGVHMRDALARFDGQRFLSQAGEGGSAAVEGNRAERTR